MKRFLAVCLLLVLLLLTMLVAAGLADPFIEPSADLDGAHLSPTRVFRLGLALRLDWWALQRLRRSDH